MVSQVIFVKIKDGCAYFTMCIFHFPLIDLDLWNAFCEVSPRGSFFKYSPKANESMQLWGWGYDEKKHKKLFIGIPLNFTFSIIYLWNYKKFEGKISDCNKKNWEFHLKAKNFTVSGWTMRDENVISITLKHCELK